MAVAIRLTRVGATKRPSYRVIAIDKRRSRDGRALEILGFYDPLTDPATVRLETDKIKAWIGKGAQPSDRVMRFLDAAGVAKREKRNNPEKSIPRKERKAKKEEANKAAEAAKAEAKAKADAAARERAIAQEAAKK